MQYVKDISSAKETIKIGAEIGGWERRASDEPCKVANPERRHTSPSFIVRGGGQSRIKPRSNLSKQTCPNHHFE
jgi:hypothetical protein